MKELKEKFKGMMSALYKEDGASLRVEILEEPEVTSFIDAHAEILDSSFAKTDMSDILRDKLKNSDWIFSGMKTFHELNEAFPSLLDENGERKPFEQFLNDVQRIDNTYNRNYLNAEYNFAQGSAEMAAKWEGFIDDGDDYLLQYRTQQDSKVRPEHAELHGITLPVTDSFWDEYFPPNGWNCRCTVVQVLKNKAVPTDHDEAMSRGKVAVAKDTKGMFRFNPGKEQRTFPAYNPYTISKCLSCPKAQLKLNEGSNVLCKGCDTIHKHGDITALLKGLHEKHGKQYVDDLRAIIQMKIFKPVKGLKDVYSAIGKTEKDYDNLIIGARKLSDHGYTVYILPNPTGTKSGDYILTRNRFIGLYDLKTILGESSAGNRLLASIGQARRVVLNITSDYSPRLLAVNIEDYFNSNSNALEVIVLKGGKMVTVIGQDIGPEFKKRFFKEYTKKK